VQGDVGGVAPLITVNKQSE